MDNDVVKRLRAELILARSYYQDDVNYINTLEKFVKIFESSNIEASDTEIKIFAAILVDYVNKGFRLSPVNINTDEFIGGVCSRCPDVIKYKTLSGEKKLLIAKPYKIEVTNEYRVNNNKLVKIDKPTTRFNGDCIALYINKGGIISRYYLILEALKEYPKTKYIEPEDIKVTIPVTMIDDPVKNLIIFAVDHKSKALKQLLEMYEHHYEINDEIYYNIRNKTTKY